MRIRLDYPKVGGQNSYSVSKEEKVRRGMELLARHFDVVTVGNHRLFQEKILNMTQIGNKLTYRTLIYSGGSSNLRRKKWNRCRRY